MNQISDFLNNPLVAPLYTLLVICLVDLLFGVYRSFQQGVFDWAKLPKILDTVVLQKVVPLAGIGIASFFVTDGTAKTALEAAYLGGSAAALVSAVADLISKATGSFVATNTAQDKGTLIPVEANPVQPVTVPTTPPTGTK